MRHITQEDIARRLGVTRITVSKALRDHPDISATMKRRVSEAAEELGYSPNEIARQLTSRKTKSIGVIVPDLENSFFSHVVNSIVDEATGSGYQTLLTVSRESEELEHRNLMNLLGKRVDGLLVCLSQHTTDRKVFQRIRKMEIPLLFFDRAFNDLGFSSVVFDDEAGMQRCVDRLVELGYLKMGHLAGFAHTSVGRERLEGFRKALEKHHLEIRDEWILEGGFEVSDGYRSFMKLLSCSTLPEVLITVNDRVAYGALRAMSEASISVPDQMGVVGFGFLETGMTPNTLSMVTQDPRTMGREAARRIIREISGNEPDTPVSIRLQTELFFQNTTMSKI